MSTHALTIGLATCLLFAPASSVLAQSTILATAYSEADWRNVSDLDRAAFEPAIVLERHGVGSRRSNPVASSAIWTGLLGALPGVAVGAALDRWALGDEYSEDPGFKGAIVGGALGFGLGGIIGAHHASGGKGDIRIPLAALGFAAAVMALDVEAGYAASLAAVMIAIETES